MKIDALYSPEEKYFDYRADLHKITPPTLVVVGDKDWICPPSKSAWRLGRCNLQKPLLTNRKLGIYCRAGATRRVVRRA